MRMKRIFSVGAALVTAVCIFAGCTSDIKALPYVTDFIGNIPENYISANAKQSFGTPFDGYVKCINLSEKFAYIENSHLSLDYIGYCDYLVVGEDIEGSLKYGLYSMSEDSLVIPCEYDSVNITALGYSITPFPNIPKRFQIIANLVKGTQRGVYNVSERCFSIEMGDYSYVNVNITSSGYKELENRITILASDNKSVNEVYDVTVGRDWNVIRTKIEQTDVVGAVLSQENSFVTYPQFPALDGYSYRVAGLSSKLAAYKDGKQVFEVITHTYYNNSMLTFMVNKYLFYQYKIQLSDDAKDYNYSTNGTKYKLTTCRLDMTNGTIKEYDDFGYIINSTTVKYDKNKKPMYLMANCTQINGDKLLNSNVQMLFDDNLEETANMSYFELDGSITKLSNNRFLSGHYIFDADGNIVADLYGYSDFRFCANEKAISLSNGSYYGLIDTDGKILIPFEYRYSFEFYNGSALNYDYKYNQYMVDKNGNKSEVISGNQYPSGLFYSKIYSNSYPYNYTFTFKNYTGTVLLEYISYYDNFNSYSFYREDSSYKSGILIEITDYGKTVYFVLS